MLAIVMAGGYGDGESGILRAMLEVRRAAAVDLVEKLAGESSFQVVVVSDDHQVLAEARKLLCKAWDTSGGAFRWLNVVQDVVHAYARPDEDVLVLGGCAAPLLQAGALAELAQSLASGEVWQNNRLSPDMVMWKPASAVSAVESCQNDNEFGYALEQQAGLSVRFFPSDLGFRFDLDTPVDALLAAASFACGPRLRKAVVNWGQQVPIERVRAVLHRSDYPDVALIGRVNPVEAERFGQAIGVRVRIFSEERGMKALGRVERGEVRSLLGSLVEAVGWKRFFELLGEQVQCALFDTRVILEHFGVRVSEEERYAADLGWMEQVRNPFLRELAQAALDAPIPVLMGGQSLVGGGLRLWMSLEDGEAS